jgi:hypothetical protein
VAAVSPAWVSAPNAPATAKASVAPLNTTASASAATSTAATQYVTSANQEPVFFTTFSKSNLDSCARTAKPLYGYMSQLFATCASLPDLALASVLHACWAASHEMQHKEYQAHNQGNVNESGSYVKCEKPKQPKNNQN